MSEETKLIKKKEDFDDESYNIPDPVQQGLSSLILQEVKGPSNYNGLIYVCVAISGMGMLLCPIFGLLMSSFVNQRFAFDLEQEVIEIPGKDERIQPIYVADEDRLKYGKMFYFIGFVYGIIFLICMTTIFRRSYRNTETLK